MKNKKIKTFTQLSKFAIAGFTALVINLGILYFLTEKIGLYYLISAAIAFAIAITVSFFINERWTFHVFTNPRLEYKKYVFVNTLILFGDIFLLSILVSQLGLWYLFAQAIAIVFLGTLNFFIQKNWTFKEDL